MNNKYDTNDLPYVVNTADSYLFDFDGVLADSEPFFRKSWNTALEPWGYSISEEDYWKYWSSLGEGIEGEIRRNGLQGIDIQLVKDRQREIYRGYVNKGLIPLYPGAAQLLEILSSENKAPARAFCIASNTSSSLVSSILTAGGAPVPLIVGGENLKKKPAPDIFLRAASLLGCIPSSTLVFEDSWKGIKAAETGGFSSVLVLNRCNRRLDIESQFVIDGIQEIIDLLAGGNMQ